MKLSDIVGSWASNTSFEGFALTVGLTILSIVILIVGFFYYGMIKSSDVAKSLTRALVWGAVLLFTTLIFLFLAVWG